MTSRCAIVVALLCAVGCAHKPSARFDTKARRTCLVLSVGGPAGVAHIGAIAAVKEAGVPIDCVVGNSMGALVGSLYATAPREDVDARFRNFVSATPIQDACAAFPDANLLAINVTGQPIFTDASMTCPVLEVRIDPQPVAAAESMELGDGYRRLVDGGRAATRAALVRL